VLEPDQRHLTEEEIRKAVEVGDTPDHAVQCESCSRIIALAREGDKAMRKLSEGSSLRPGPDCASNLDIAGLASGYRKEEDLLLHVSQCDWCGQRLKQALGDLTQELTAEESKLMASLASGQPEWQQKLVISLVRPKRATWIPYAAAAVLIEVLAKITYPSPWLKEKEQK
jgi:hypothetical protein